MVLSCLTTGCSYRNERLNPANVPLQDRAPNATRAAIGADVRPRPAANRGGDRPEVTTRPTPPGLARRTADITDADGYFVGLAISGGGSRSANFAAGCMFQLDRLGLLRRVDYISSVSGGSLTAAYYCSHGDGEGEDDWNPGTVQRKLTHAFADDIIRQTFLPWNLVALGVSDYDRTDLLANSFEANLFKRGNRPLTFGDLRPDRPRLLMNATDLQSGRRFVFCDERFDEINSDLARYPLARAVAASAAVPVLLHHVTLRDYSTVFKQYVHLIDGSVVDNLGVETLAETYNAHVAQAAAAGRPDPYPRGAVIIVLDATTRFDATLSSQSDFGFLTSLITGAGLSTTALVNRVSSANLGNLIIRNSADHVPAVELRKLLDEMEATGFLRMEGRTGRPVRVVHLALSRVEDLSELPFESFGRSVNNIATYFNIDPTEAFYLYQAARLLVEDRFEERLAGLVEEMSEDDKVTR